MVGRYGFGCEPASAASVAGAHQLVQEGVIGKDERVVFLHTGGAVGLFGYTGFFEQAMG